MSLLPALGGLRIINTFLKFYEDSHSKSEIINDDIDTQVNELTDDLQ